MNEQTTERPVTGGQQNETLADRRAVERLDRAVAAALAPYARFTKPMLVRHLQRDAAKNGPLAPFTYEAPPTGRTGRPVRHEPLRREVAQAVIRLDPTVSFLVFELRMRLLGHGTSHTRLRYAYRAAREEVLDL